MSKEIVRITISMAADQHEALRKLSFDTRIAIAEHVRRALDDYLEKIRTAK